MYILDAKVVRCYCSVCGANSDSGICNGATGPSEDSSEFNVCERPFRPRRLNACALCGRAFSPKTGLFNLFSGTSPTVRGLTAPVAVDLRTGFRLLIAELRKSAVNNRKSSFKDGRNRDWLSTGNVEELKNAPQFQMHPIYSWDSHSLSGLGRLKRFSKVISELRAQQRLESNFNPPSGNVL